MRKLVDRPLFGDMLDSQLLLNSLQLLISLFHHLVFFINFINFSLKLSLDILWKHGHCSALSRSLLFHEFFNSAKFCFHFNDFCLKEIFLGLEGSVLSFKVKYLISLVLVILGNRNLFARGLLGWRFCRAARPISAHGSCST